MYNYCQGLLALPLFLRGETPLWLAPNKLLTKLLFFLLNFYIFLYFLFELNNKLNKI
ncbi:hypothetical protein C1336_000780002 [Campylobacter jejuni subsp. jejuni 1336]|nr:hypothetical protein C1336_000780002 [Campylobacter jejuni subsp. jejuni 1336]